MEAVPIWEGARLEVPARSAVRALALIRETLLQFSTPFRNWQRAQSADPMRDVPWLRRFEPRQRCRGHWRRVRKQSRWEWRRVHLVAGSPRTPRWQEFQGRDLCRNEW